MLLYPRLRHTTARKVALGLSGRSISDLAALSRTMHEDAIWSPTGGRKASESELATVRQEVLRIAQENRYPDTKARTGRRLFDADVGAWLHQNLHLSAHEAATGEVWAFFGCVLLPDVVRWRFPGKEDSKDVDRFLGSARGLRNTFGRVWWRAHLLHDAAAEDPYELLRQMNEDELVGITERPNLAGSRSLVRQICRSLCQTAEQGPGVPRTEILRDAMKRFQRLMPLVSFETLDDAELKPLVDEVFTDSVAALSLGGRARQAG